MDMRDALHSLERRVAYTLSDVSCVLERASAWSDITTINCPYATPYVEALYGKGTYRNLNEVKKTMTGASSNAKKALGRLSASILTSHGHAHSHIRSRIHALDANLKFISDLIRLLMIMMWGSERASELATQRISSMKKTPKSLLFFSFTKKTQVKTA